MHENFALSLSLYRTLCPLSNSFHIDIDTDTHDYAQSEHTQKIKKDLIQFFEENLMHENMICGRELCITL